MSTRAPGRDRPGWTLLPTIELPERPDRRSILRLAALAGFLLTVAVALWLAELRPLLVITVMAAALLVAGAVEWLAWHRDVARIPAGGRGVAEEKVDLADGEPAAVATLLPPPRRDLLDRAG